jgi:hypothetical protein
MNQIEIITLNSLVPANYIYRQFYNIWSFDFVENTLRLCEKNKP